LISQEGDPVEAWFSLGTFGLDEAVAPGFGVRDPELARRALALAPADGRPEVILLALALDGVARDGRAALLDRLAVPARIRDGALVVADRAARTAEALRQARDAAEIAAAVGDGAGVELAAVAGALGAEAPAREWLEHLRHLRLAISGDDLLAAGVAPGPALGAGLAAARVALLEGRADSREEQLAEALRVARDAGLAGDAG
jgi:hypothetical protein